MASLSEFEDHFWWLSTGQWLVTNPNHYSMSHPMKFAFRTHKPTCNSSQWHRWWVSNPWSALPDLRSTQLIRCRPLSWKNQDRDRLEFLLPSAFLNLFHPLLQLHHPVHLTHLLLLDTPVDPQHIVVLMLPNSLVLWLRLQRTAIPTRWKRSWLITKQSWAISFSLNAKVFDPQKPPGNLSKVLTIVSISLTVTSATSLLLLQSLFPNIESKKSLDIEKVGQDLNTRSSGLDTLNQTTPGSHESILMVAQPWKNTSGRSGGSDIAHPKCSVHYILTPCIHPSSSSSIDKCNLHRHSSIVLTSLDDDADVLGSLQSPLAAQISSKRDWPSEPVKSPKLPPVLPLTHTSDTHWNIYRAHIVDNS